LLEEVGTVGSQIGEPEIRNVEKTGALFTKAADTTRTSTDFPKIRELKATCGLTEADVREIGRELTAAASQAREVLKDDSVFQRVERSAELVIDRAKEQATLWATGKREMDEVGKLMPIFPAADVHDVPVKASPTAGVAQKAQRVMPPK